jgi:hypothetical protein
MIFFSFIFVHKFFVMATYNPIVDGKESAERGLTSLPYKPKHVKSRLMEDVEEQADITAMNMTNELFNQWDGRANINGIFLAPSKGPESAFDRVWGTSKGVPASFMGNNPDPVPCPIIVNTANESMAGAVPAHVSAGVLGGVQAAGDIGLEMIKLYPDYRASASMNMLSLGGDMHLGNIRAKVQAWNSKPRILQAPLPKAPTFHGNQNTYRTALDLERGRFMPTPTRPRKGMPDTAVLEAIRHTDPGNEEKRMESRRLADPGTMPTTVVTKELAQSKINMPDPSMPLPSVIPIDAPLLPPDMTPRGKDAIYMKALHLGTTAGQDKLFGKKAKGLADPSGDASYSPQMTVAMAGMGEFREWKDGEQPQDADDAMGMERPESPFLEPPVIKNNGMPTPSPEAKQCAPKMQAAADAPVAPGGKYRPPTSRRASKYKPY